MEHFLDEYRTLVTQTRLFLARTLPKHTAPTHTLQNLQIIKNEPIKDSSTEPLVNSTPPPKAPPLQKRRDEPKIIAPIAQEEELTAPLSPVALSTVGPFTLEKNTPFIPLDLSAMRSLLKQFSPARKQSVEISLLCTQEEELPFYQKIREALSQRGLSCKVTHVETKELQALLPTLEKQTILTQSNLAIAQTLGFPSPLSCHTLFPFSQQNRILFLHPVLLYESDKEQKRHLWNSLQQLLPQ